MRAPTQRQVWEKLEEARKSREKCFDALLESLNGEQTVLLSLYLKSRNEHEETARTFRKGVK